jgi:hypothetical protein
MTSAIPPTKRIQVLFNTLTAERYARRALLTELVDELASTHEYGNAVSAGRALLERLDVGINDREYEQAIASLAELMRHPARDVCASAAQ